VFRGTVGGSISTFFTLLSANITQKKNYPKVFKLHTVNDLEISYKWYGLGVERSKVKVRDRVRVNSNTAWSNSMRAF